MNYYLQALKQQRATYPYPPVDWAEEILWEAYRDVCDEQARLNPARPMNRFEQMIWDARGGAEPK